MAVRRRVRCPGCGKRPVRYYEHWDGHGIVFEAGPDGTPEEVGYLYEGRPTHVTARCGCGKEWRLRGVLQITNLRPAAPAAAPEEKKK